VKTLEKIIGRKKSIFDQDLTQLESVLNSIVSKSTFLILGGAGSVGQAVSKEIIKRNPIAMHVVDLSENNLVELVRDIRSSNFSFNSEFKTFPLDIGSSIYDSFFLSNGKYDYVINLSAIKHVRSEKNIYSLTRMIDVNILNTIKTLEQSIKKGVKKYFSVSTDKATNPVNLMGASKRAMELVLMDYSNEIDVSSARFANVAFSDGSLLKGFINRLDKKQPFSAPIDVKRYFMSEKEAGELCLISCLVGQNRDIMFPTLSTEDKLKSFRFIAQTILLSKGYRVFECNEKIAKRDIDILIKKKYWPCVFSKSNTTGEKSFEEFYRSFDKVNTKLFDKIGIIKSPRTESVELRYFYDKIKKHSSEMNLDKMDIIKMFKNIIPEFKHDEKKYNLDQKM